MSLRPDSPEFHNNRGNTLREMNRIEASLDSFETAVRLKPDYAEAYSNFGSALREAGRIADARRAFDTAIRLAPGEAGMRYNKAIVALQEHDFREGFDLYRERWNTEDFDSPAPELQVAAWDGMPPSGRLLLWAEQGIGDEVFYASLFSLLDLDRLQVTVSADKRLHSLYRRSFPGIDLIDRTETQRVVSGNFAAQAPIGDLGYLLDVDTAKIAARRYPYLVAGAERKQRLRAANPRLDARPVCGVSWRSGNPRMGQSRSMGLVDLAPVLEGLPYQFVNLQYGDVAAEIGAARAEKGLDVQVLEDLDVFNDLEGLSAAIDMCDVVLSTDNATAHFAGALGKRGIVMIPLGKARYWYWAGERQSLWYPSLSLVYQERVGDWEPVLAGAGRLLKT